MEIDTILSQSYKVVNFEDDAVATIASKTGNMGDSSEGRSKIKGHEMNQLSKKTVNQRCVSLVSTAINLHEADKTDFNRKKGLESAHQQESRGKKVILAKYLNDLKHFAKRASKKASGKLGKRELADGTDVPETCFGRHVEGSGEPSVSVNRETVSMANCRYHWQRHSDSDSESDMSENSFDDEQETDEETDISNTSSLSADFCALDTAFVKSSRYSESDEGIDVTSMSSCDLDTAFVADFERRCVTDEDYSALTYSDGDFERNISTSDYVKKIFGADDALSVGSQDSEVDSFMMSRLDSF